MDMSLSFTFKKTFLYILFSYCCLAWSSLQANNNQSRSVNDGTADYMNFSLEELSRIKVFIASGTEQTVNEAPSTVTVITEEDMQKTGAVNISDVLEGVPGIHVSHSHFAYRPQIHTRGTKSPQTLIMINGNL